VIDHLNRGSLDLSQLRCLVLDEADEMLRMGFIDDVEAVLKKTPESRQVALFSATMPQQIKRIAQTYLKDPVEIAIRSTTTTAANIRQRYWMVSGVNKLDALTRILEAEPFDAMLVFARTKLGAQELAEKLAARGLSAAPIHGDIEQKQREKMIQSLKDGRIDILVATDVAARGLDVDRISHVLNYDIPYDTESYVHRIGRTGRAGRSGEAILFVAPRERSMLLAIERATRQKIEPMQLPSVEAVNDQRVARFLGRITEALGDADLALFRDLVERYEREHNVPAVEIAAALASLAQGQTPLLLQPPAAPSPAVKRYERKDAPGEPREHAASGQRAPREPGSFAERPAPKHAARQFTPPRPDNLPGNSGEALFNDDAPTPRPKREKGAAPEIGMETFRIEVGHAHGVQPGNIVGAIANEADLESRYIGRIDIRDDYSLVDLPEGMPRELMEHLKKVRVAGQPLRIQRAGPGDTSGGPGRGQRPHTATRAPRPHAGKPDTGGPRKPFKPRPPHRGG
ncbi:MAG: DbpA RNA binding domain-containing protein, partial [Gammaproteobacteria bacterium]|nr:DbpA RNA binding domain-containing protein [Gammaproteobacteria bacterium]